MLTHIHPCKVLFNQKISERADGFLSATDVVRAGNVLRSRQGLASFNLAQFLKNRETAEFISELEVKYGRVIEIKRGNGGCTWVHPLLFIDIALAISPKLKVEVYEWLFDHLIKNRNDSGDSYKKMSSALYLRHANKRDFPRFISKVADFIREKCGVEDWQSATEDQLYLRDKIHNSIGTLTNVLTDTSQAVRLGVHEHIKTNI